MKFSYNWLKELSDTIKSAEGVAEDLTMHSFEVEGLEKIGEDLEKVVVGKILEIEKHPNADKLQVTKTDIGEKVLQIVCGAPNILVGDIVPVALVGAKLPNGMEIREAEIRGVKSFGMLCAEDELGLGDDHKGILKLEKGLKLGMPITEVLGIEDTILEMKLLPDRAHDAQSYVGVAREIAVLEDREFDYDFEGLKLPNKKSKKLKVEIKDNDLCFRYIGAVLEEIEIKDSPQWIKTKLLASGLRPINNVVDATNLVMLELGQPTHAFDFSLITKKETAQIIVRRAKKAEKIKLLDETIKELDQNNLLITNGEEALALAGIMGGENSGIKENTKRIILECASFDATTIRKTRKKLNVKTDASDRFEKELDPNLTEKAMVRLIEIIEHTANGKLEGVIDIYPKEVNPWKIKLDLAYVDRLLGEKIPSKISVKILNLLGIKIKTNKNIIEAIIPTYRVDLKTQEDLIEEIGRINGYDKIKVQAPKVHLEPAKINEQRTFEREIKRILTGIGFDEVYNYSFYSQKDANLAQLGTIKHLELENPMNPEQALMRISLIPSLLKNIAQNLKNYKDIHLFEIGRVYWANGEVLPREKRMLVGAIVLEKSKKAENFYEAKGFIDSLMQRIGVTDHYYDNFKAVPVETFVTLWHEGRSAEIKIEGHEKAVGFMGEINPLVLADFDIHHRVAMFEFDLELLQEFSDGEREFQSIRRFPDVARDISMLSTSENRVDDILEVIQDAGGELVLDVDLFDIFEKETETSYAFHIIFGADRTLEGKEVDLVMAKIISELENKLGVEIRK